MRPERFGPSSRGPVQRITLGSEPGPVLELLDLGATVHRLWVTGGDGVRRNVVLGHATAEEYLASSDFVGGTIGRYANRIRGGSFPLEGRTVRLATNEGANQLHGGPDGFHRRVWEVAGGTEDEVTFRLVSPDGDQGFPGRLVATARFAVSGDRVRVDLGAEADATTVVNLTSHVYLNLDGDGTGPVDAQLLAVHAQDYLPVDDAGLPLSPVPVEATGFDLRRPTLLGAVIGATGGLDHDFVIDGAGLRRAATLLSPATRTRVDLHTDQPGLQVYTGNALDGSRRSSTGRPYRRGDGLALEPQLPPDTPNRPDLGSAVLEPGTSYHSRVEWRFGHG